MLPIRKNSQHLIKVVRMQRGTMGHSTVSLHELLRWMQIARVQGDIHANWLRPSALEILPSISFQTKLLTYEIFWTSGRLHSSSINAFKSSGLTVLVL